MEYGTILNQTYQILQPLGSGGVGEIYLGFHNNLQKYVVIKKIKDSCSGLLNSRIEVDILKSLRHTYLPQVYDFLEIGDSIFTVMDYIPGHDLKYYLDHGYVFPEEQLILWMKQLCQVLEYLHSRKPAIIHCDIKPANIMVTEDGNICLIDFNISLDGENNKELVGLSSIFASPEQTKKAEYTMLYGSGDKIKMDERTDLYSLGAVFYNLMTGVQPKTGTDPVLPLHIMEPPYSEGLINIVEKAMEENPEKRFRSARKMLNALEHIETWSGEYRRLLRAGMILDITAGCMGILLLVLAVWGYRGMKTDVFFDAQEIYLDQVQEWTGSRTEEASEEVVTNGIRLLNTSDFETFYQDYPLEKANVLYGIGQASLFLENYQYAEPYLVQAADLNQENPDIYRDLAYVRVQMGALQEAEETMKKAEDLGLAKEDARLIQAEIATERQEYETAWEYAVEAADSQNSSVMLLAASLVMDLTEILQNTQDAIAFFQERADTSSGVSRAIWLRKEGELCLQAEQSGSGGYLKQASACFEELYSRGYAQLTDLLNLASVYQESGNFVKCRTLLQEMKKIYPEDYRIPVRQAFLYYQEENKKAVSDRDYRQVMTYYQEAYELCQQSGIQPEEDLNMLQMKEIVDLLKQQGENG